MPELVNLLKKSSISLLLDSYDAIFSDFDPRPFNERSISDDFLIEAQKVIRETDEGAFELHFLIPKNLHNPHEDGLVKERLHHHFRQSEHQIQTSLHQDLKKGILITALGFLFMLITSVATVLSPQNSWLDVTLVVFEPAGWFLVWYGLDAIFYQTKQKKNDLAFYRKMTKAEIHFDTY
jgi:hypothetical protein